MKEAAIERKVNVRLLISWWKHSRKSEDYFLKSIEDLTNSFNKVKIEVVSIFNIPLQNLLFSFDWSFQLLITSIQFSQKRFIVPTTPEFDKIPFARVNHNKYMVTDMAAYIGTSNWSGDYFVNTGGT